MGVDEMEMWLARAYHKASASPDYSNQNGAVVVDTLSGSLLSSGCNDFPTGFEMSPTDAAVSREEKYRNIEHAERAAIYLLAGNRPQSHGDLLLASPWAACHDCARAIVLSGIGKILVHRERMLETPPRWQNNIAEAIEKMKKAGVEVLSYSGRVKARPIFVNGRLWSPETLSAVVTP